MDTYNRHENFLLKFDSTSGTDIRTIWEPSTTARESSYLRSVEHVVLNGFVKTLRARSQVTSIEQLDLPSISIEQSRTERLSIVRNIEWSSERKHLCLHLRDSFGHWQKIATVSILNIPPYRLINLQEYYSPNLMIELGEGGAIGASIENAGYGLLSGQDEVLIYGNATTEVVVIPQDVPPIEVCDPYSWSLADTPQMIIPASQNRKQVTLVNTGSSIVYLNFGAQSPIGAGIALMPNGGSYELNRTNYPMNLSIYAIAETSSTLTGIVCR